HRVLHAPATSPITAGVHAETLGRLERQLAEGAFVRQIEAAPGTERELGRHYPTAARAFCARQSTRVGPALRTPAVGAPGPEALQRITTDAALVHCRGLESPPSTRGHSAPRPRR